MYNRSKKDDYRKRIEEMIGGRQKRSRGNSVSNSNTTSGDINDSSSGTNDNAKNDEPNINKIRVQRWNPVGTRVEGQLTNLEKKIDNIAQDIREIKEELKELKKLKEAQQPNLPFLMDAVKNIAKLTIKMSIYPSKEELRGATEAYLKENHIEFFNSFSEICWTSYYNNNIYKSLLKQVRSLRGSLATKIREAMFATFGEVNLPLINSNAGPSEIAKWKKRPEVSQCFKNLFKNIDDDDKSPLVITHIVEKVFLGKKYSDSEFAYVVAICRTILNPKHDVLQMKESIIKSKVDYYLDRIGKKLTLADDDDDDNNSDEDESGEE